MCYILDMPLYFYYLSYGLGNSYVGAVTLVTDSSLSDFCERVMVMDSNMQYLASANCGSSPYEDMYLTATPTSVLLVRVDASSTCDTTENCMSNGSRMYSLEAATGEIKFLSSDVTKIDVPGLEFGLGILVFCLAAILAVKLWR